MRTAWAGRSHFAEIAEALEVSTDHVMAAMEVDGRVTVLYTPEHAADPRESRIVGVGLRRDPAGILVTVDGPHDRGTWGEWEDAIERNLAEMR